MSGLCVLYVKDMARSSDFYSQVFNAAAVPAPLGAVRFSVGDFSFGLMPESTAKSRFGPMIADPHLSGGTSRLEMWIPVPSPKDCLERALSAGAKLLSPLQLRECGDSSASVLDPDGHVLILCHRPIF
ncbi:MAG: hypothetical protein KF799_12395 [Bdellovibrionales bacterium]|nr:hypothetical protein [Bdellovibrionales bacterium]